MSRDGGDLSMHKVFPDADIHGVRTGDDLFLHFFRYVAIRRPELYVVANGSTHPGEHSAEELKQLGMSADELARQIELPNQPPY